MTSVIHSTNSKTKTITMRCTRCNRKLKTGGYNGSSYGPTCYALLFEPERRAKVDRAVQYDGQGELFGNPQLTDSADSVELQETRVRTT